MEASQLAAQKSLHKLKMKTKKLQAELAENAARSEARLAAAASQRQTDVQELKQLQELLEGLREEKQVTRLQYRSYFGCGIISEKALEGELLESRQKSISGARERENVDGSGRAQRPREISEISLREQLSAAEARGEALALQVTELKTALTRAQVCNNYPNNPNKVVLTVCAASKRGSVFVWLLKFFQTAYWMYRFCAIVLI